MAHTSEERFLVAHGLRLKGFAEVTVVATLTGLSATAVGAHLEELRSAGHAQFREGRITGWSLTPDGRARHATACAADLDAAGCRDTVDVAYRAFLAINEPFLQVCTDWQLRGDAQTLNDHSDAAYDAGVVARLGGIDDRVQPVIGDLSADLGRFGAYGPRLADARKRVESGEHDWFTGAMVESYHTIWFELHEDLLATLGIERAKESAS